MTSENDDNSRLEKLRFQSAGRAKMCTFVAIGGGGGCLNNQIWKQSNTYKLLVIRQNDNEVSVDGMDVYAADKP